MPARPVLQRAQQVPVSAGEPRRARPAERDDDAAQARRPRDRLGGDLADIADHVGPRPLREVVDGDHEIGLGSVVVQEEQPQRPVPPGGWGDDGGDTVKDVTVGDDGDGE